METYLDSFDKYQIFIIVPCSDFFKADTAQVLFNMSFSYHDLQCKVLKQSETYLPVWAIFRDTPKLGTSCAVWSQVVVLWLCFNNNSIIIWQCQKVINQLLFLLFYFKITLFEWVGLLTKLKNFIVLGSGWYIIAL